MKKEIITLWMETTKISPEKTITEIQKLLSKYGMGQMQMRFDPQGNVESVYFTLRIENKEIPYKLPANHQALLELAKQGQTKYLKYNDEDQARRVAWRQVYRWLEAVLAFSRSKQIPIYQTLLGHMMADKDQTIYEKLVANEFEGYLIGDK